MEVDARDFFKETFSEVELRDLLGDRPVRDVFSFRSPSFKSMGLDPDDLTDDDLIRLMLQEPRLIRRPIVRLGDDLIVGANEKSLTAALGQG